MLGSKLNKFYALALTEDHQRPDFILPTLQKEMKLGDEDMGKAKELIE